MKPDYGTAGYAAIYGVLTLLTMDLNKHIDAVQSSLSLPCKRELLSGYVH